VKKRKKKGTKEPLDDWVKQQAPPNRGRNCITCSAEGVADTLRDLLKAMVRNDVRTISRKQLYAKLLDTYSREHYDASFSAFRDHLLNHEGKLWAQAKGRGEPHE
jgi:hypothetical protein